MDQLVQCPVCTLFLHNGMTLESHLDTHPKDQVIKALCSLTSKGGYDSRTSTPVHSERSYRSRSRTPATEDSMRWTVSQRSAEHDRYWRRTPSRTPSRNKSSSRNISRIGTPDVRTVDINFDNNSVQSAEQFSGSHYKDKVPQSYIQSGPISDYDPQYVCYQDPTEDKEIKYSRSAEYTSMDSTNNVFTYNMPSVAPAVKLQTTLLPPSTRRTSAPPKTNNILVKANVGGVQYITSGVKPMHVMVPTTPTFVQKNVQNSMIMTGSIPATQMLDSKSVPSSLSTTQFGPMTTAAFTPGTTVVTQNSQIIYREMVHNLDGKPFISSMPAVLSGHDNMANVAQSSSMYQNVMVVDQFGNTSCMYATPQPILPKPPCSMYNDTISHIPTTHMDKTAHSLNDSNKTLIIEVGPIVPPTTVGITATIDSGCGPSSATALNKAKNSELITERLESRNETPGPGPSTKGLKILSNIKVEVPVQHHKNMLNTVMDLTGSNDPEYPERSASPEKILPDLEDNNQIMSDYNIEPPSSSSESLVSHSFSVIKNVGNPPLYKDTNKSNIVDSKIENEFSDSCPVPDLICNEKPSISPCSELMENGENSTDRTLISPKPQSSTKSQPVENKVELPVQPPPKPRNNTLRLNNIYVKKHKKILQIKNAKPFPTTSTSTTSEPLPSSSACRSPENFTMNKIHQNEKKDMRDKGTLQTVSVEKVEHAEEQDHEFDADTELSVDMEPRAGTEGMAHEDQFTTSISVEMVQVKEEINTSNEGGFSNEASTSNRTLTPIESLRPINVISYGNMSAADFDDESNHKELLDLEAASKNKQFVNMMNENYFGDNIYADYFTPDRVESFDTERESSAFNKEGSKDNMYIWGESSQKENEFVLPNFIHESYKIADSNGMDYSEMGGREGAGEGEGCERDSKADVLSESRSESEAPLNICADERMPPRGELSGQESNDIESPWSGMYTEVTPAEPYDLIARESWVSDGSEMDTTEKRDTLEEEELNFTKTRLYSCNQCGGKFPSLKEMRSHKALVHAPASCSGEKTSYSRMLTARAIKKEEKPEETVLPGPLLSIDSKEAIASTMLQVYETMDAKPGIEGLIKQETKRRRKDFVCPTCKVDQLTDAAFHAHLKIHPLECLTCGKCFFKRANLALHIKMHLGIKNYKCEVCEKRFITRQKLMEHHNVHTGRAPVKCTVCDDTFRRYSNMVQHRDRHHFQKKSKVRDFVCQCGAVFHSRAKLTWHAETHDQRPKACPYCSDKFVHASSLTRHVRRTHNEYYLSERNKGKVDNIPCPVCKQVYLRTNLRAHLKTHTGKRPYLCIICNKAFTTKWNLKLHRWTHMSRSAKPYRCHLCKGAFIRQTEYISHMNAHKSVRPYTCNYCGCQFIRKYNCQRHVREHEMAKKFVCKVPECGKSFHRGYYLSEHMKVHSGARPFSCNICGKTSSNKSNHNKHVKIHHAREPVATEA